MNEVINYNITNARIAELKIKYQDTIEYSAVSRGISEIRSLRTSVEKKRKELKADALEWGRKVDIEAKRITGMLLEIENPLKALKSKVDEEKARVKAEKDRLEKERIDAIKAKIEYIKQASLDVVGADVLTIRRKGVEIRNIEIEFDFQEFRNEAEIWIVKTQEKLFEMLKERESLDKAKQEAEEEAKRLEKLRLERKAEQAKIDEANRLEREKLKEQQDHIDAENRKIEKERLAVLEKELRINLAQEAKEKAEKNAKELKEREAKEKAEKEEADRLAKEREEALRPDKEKLKLLAKAIADISIPIMITGTEEMIGLANKIKEMLEDVADYILFEIEEK